MKYTFSDKDISTSGSGAPAQPPSYPTTPQKRSGGGGCAVLVGVAVVVLIACAVGAWWMRRNVEEPAGMLPNDVRDSDSFADTDKSRKASDRDIVLYLESTEGEARQLFEYVRQSAFVQENAQYAALMKNVDFVYASTNDEVNAVASRQVMSDGKESRYITCYAGEMRFAKTIALAAAAEMSGRRGAVQSMMEKMTPNLCVALSLQNAAGLLRSCGLDACLLDESIRAKAKSVGAGCVVGILAHEIGHQVLGHNYQAGKDRLNQEVLRNFESQADLFAASVMSSSPFGEYVFAGRVFALWVRMRQTDPILKRLPSHMLDHPLDKERFVALVLSNKEKATALGIKIPELLP